MLIPSLTTIRIEDLPSQKDWIGKLLLPLNQFLLSVTSAINGNISFGDNIPCQTQSLKFVYGSSADFPKAFVWSLSAAPVELRVCSATEDSVAIAVVIAWSYSGGQVSVSNIYKITSSGVSALTVGSLYNITLRGNP